MDIGRFYLAAKAKINEKRNSTTETTRSSIEETLTSESASF